MCEELGLNVDAMGLTVRSPRCATTSSRTARRAGLMNAFRVLDVDGNGTRTAGAEKSGEGAARKWAMPRLPQAFLDMADTGRRRDQCCGDHCARGPPYGKRRRIGHWRLANYTEFA